jgi:ABC-type oligopeptide transport system substrate-binding subunit
MKDKIRIFILILLFLSIAIFLCAEEENQTDKEKAQKNLNPPVSAELPEVSPAHPIEKEGKAPSTLLLLAEPVIANPAEEE